MILAGLNEGVWPAGLGADPWLSRGMRIAANLGAPERRYGLAAHDFAQLAAAPEVILTRAGKADGAPTVASRWVWRLKTLARGALGEAGARAALAPGTDYLALARALDAPDPPLRPRPAPRPSPCPPVAERPRKLSITEIRTWVRDPYSIFARHLLGLRRLDPADMPPGARERGTALHEALQMVVPEWREAVPADAEDRLVAAAEPLLAGLGFQPGEMAVELARFRRAARWLVAWERQRRAQGITVDQVEIRGEITLAGPAGDFVLHGGRTGSIGIRTGGST